MYQLDFRQVPCFQFMLGRWDMLGCCQVPCFQCSLYRTDTMGFFCCQGFVSCI